MKPLEQKILKHLRDRGWDKLRPADVAKSIMIEGAELLELFQWENLPLDEVKKDKAKIEEIKKELADVLIYSLEMSVLLGLDTEKIIRKKLALAQKKYPARLMKNNGGKEPGTESVYWKKKSASEERSMKGVFTFISDKYRKTRGGHSRWLLLLCEKCHKPFAVYQKDGPGSLKRMYLDRIAAPEALKDLQKRSFKQLKNLTCPSCEFLLGVPIIYPDEKRPAFRLFQGAVEKKVIKGQDLGRVQL
ncbi:hypothetical protein EDM68_03200 [Candidatus Uhrbacteria bacterium]|nr:MAG: hypothetical protein EDM68_03200 [Candidatus Uhrbacteria bacterium]